MQNTEHTIWTKSKSLVNLSALSCAIFFAINGNALAAKVPEGVVLADKQEVRIQTTAEAATLDPQKMEGTGKVY